MASKRTNPIHYEGDLRADLIAEALRVIADGGPSAVSLRALARDLGVSHAAPKNHFPTKESLFAEIAREGFVLFEAKLAAAGEATQGADANALGMIEAMGLAYLEFAREHASHFALMFRSDLFDPEVIVADSSKAFDVLQRAVRVGQENGWHASADPELLATLLWSTVHGYAHLEAEGMPIANSPSDRAAMLRLAVQSGRPSSAD